MTGIAPAPAVMPISMRKIATQVEAFARNLRVQMAAECDGNKLNARLDPLCRFYILDAFRQMGWQLRAGERVTLAFLVEAAARGPEASAGFRQISFIPRSGRTAQPLGRGMESPTCSKNPGHEFSLAEHSR